MNEKQLAGEKAADYVTDGMIVGLGTGSTAYYAVKKIGERVRQGLKITAVSTSHSTAELAESLHIPLVSLNDVERIDVTIDGADEIDCQFNGIKGGGGAHLIEKLVAKASREIIWVVDSGKLVQTLGRFPLPVEVIPFGWKHVFSKFEQDGLNPVLRKKDDNPVLTDSKNYILDLHLEKIEHPEELEGYLNGITGVVEHGLFLNMVTKVVVGKEDTAEILEPQN